MKNNISTEKVLSIINKAIDIGFNSNAIKCLLEVLEKALDKANAQNCILHHLNKITNDKNYIINDDSFIEYLNTFPLDVEKVYTVYERKIDNIYICDDIAEELKNNYKCKFENDCFFVLPDNTDIFIELNIMKIEGGGKDGKSKKFKKSI